MGIVTSLTELEVKEYMFAMMGDTATKLGWSVAGGDFNEPANEILYSLEEANYTFVNSQIIVRKVRAIARVEAWRAATYYTAHEVTHSTGAPGTGQTSRTAIHQHCQSMFIAAKSQYIESYPDEQPDSSVARTAVTYEGDYYSNAGE